MSRIPYLFHSFSDFVVYAVTTLIFPKNQWQCAKFSLNVAFLFLSFKRATTVLNKLIDSKHFKQLRRKTLMAFHSPSHINPKTNFQLLQNDSETGTVEPRLSGLSGTRVNSPDNRESGQSKIWISMRPLGYIFPTEMQHSELCRWYETHHFLRT